MSPIIVNATAARSSGALSILKQFINNIPSDSENIYYIFIDPNIEIPIQANQIKYIPIDTKQWSKRIIWDFWEMRKWIKKNNIQPTLIISLQNTGINYDRNIPQLIYYHQPLPLSSHSWNIKKKEEFILFIYKHFYSFFVSLYIHENTHFVVQIPSIKKAFLKKFNVEKGKVHVIPPEIPTVTSDEVNYMTFEDNKVHFIYPATLFVYKNHGILLQALQILRKEDNDIFRNIKIHLTIKKEDLNSYKNLHEIEEAISFEGTIPFPKLMAYYKSMNALLFPSYIESFGLPLLEAASTGISIIASNLPYVHDVVGKYQGTSYVNYQDARGWANAMKEAYYSKRRYEPFTYPPDRGNWKTFFELIEKIK